MLSILNISSHLFWTTDFKHKKRARRGLAKPGGHRLKPSSMGRRVGFTRNLLGDPDLPNLRLFPVSSVPFLEERRAAGA